MKEKGKYNSEKGKKQRVKIEKERTNEKNKNE